MAGHGGAGAQNITTEVVLAAHQHFAQVGELHRGRRRLGSAYTAATTAAGRREHSFFTRR